MSMYFNSPERILKLREEALKWVGTPFADYSAVPGRDGGVSCGYLVFAVLQASGCCPADLRAPKIGWKDNHGAVDSSILSALVGFLHEGYLLSLHRSDSLRPGDVIGIRIKSCLDHLALYVGPGEFLSIRIRQRVQLGEYAGLKNYQAWRPLEV